VLACWQGAIENSACAATKPLLFFNFRSFHHDWTSCKLTAGGLCASSHVLPTELVHAGAIATPLERLLEQSDIVTLHVPLDASTKGYQLSKPASIWIVVPERVDLPRQAQDDPSRIQPRPVQHNY
jgi:hypothetical protein